ncbi:hypothetical protein TrVE_jg880 [Triparma verrucosa]|uniref:Uncharacterized protein n=1 Tax=Triparma verrucosa TaxID=1606542 RepID=A0A9W7BJR6_9STRA|nr:hypothetical protein TrVE_jg880 [Triparma verrucosa]
MSLCRGVKETLATFDALQVQWRSIRSLPRAERSRSSPVQEHAPPPPPPPLMPFTPSPTALNPFAQFLVSPKAPVKNKSNVCLGLGLESLK